MFVRATTSASHRMGTEPRSCSTPTRRRQRRASPRHASSQTGLAARRSRSSRNGRYHEQLGHDTIAERLNQDLDRHPPPEPPGRTRARNAWSKSSVRELLANPKYTGDQVYNRRARRSRGGRNKANPPEMWVWSAEPAHEPLIPKWMFDELNARSPRRGSRDGATLKSDPRARGSYLFRRRVLCDCGRCMIGTVRPSGIYYRCHPAGNNRGRPDKHAGHPPTVYIREDVVTADVKRFFAERVFGPQRRELLLADLNTVDDTAQRERDARRQRLRRRLADTARKQENVLRQAEDADPHDPFTQGLRQHYNDLETERQAQLAAMSDLDQLDEQEPDTPSTTSSASSTRSHIWRSIWTAHPSNCSIDSSTRPSSRSRSTTRATKRRYE